MPAPYRGVAQSGSASALGAEGRRFESCRPDHLGKRMMSEQENNERLVKVVMIGLTLRFENEAKMFEWLEDMVGGA